MPTPVGTVDPAPEDRQLIDELVALWHSHQERGLHLRWQTGDMLNRRLGPPDKRLAHGKQVLKTAAEKLQIGESEVSRMRWFAALFGSAKDFQEARPEVRSWTKVKKVLPDLIAARRGRKKTSPCRKNAVATRVLRSLTTATKWFRRPGTDPDDATGERMLKALTQLMEAASERLQIRLKIESEGDA